MRLYSSNDNYKLYQGNMLDMLEVIESNSIDSIVTDSPYELNFMGKGWDNAGVSFQKETWGKCYEVLKPGGYLLAFGGSRTFHRVACAIEDAGFEIRDTIMWLYGSGFPKSMNIGLAIDKKNGVEIKNEWKGWGTCLKPSFEPIIMARKPFKGSCIDNVIKWGVGGINIDECRIETNGEQVDIHHTKGASMFNQGNYKEINRFNSTQGRFPANTILTYDQITFDEVCGGFPNTKGNGNIRHNKNNGKGYNCYSNYGDCETKGYEGSGSASRYFYCAKASKKDRDEGLEEFGQQKVNDGRKKDADNAFQGGATLRHNIHPTVKPTELMQYLIRLVTPNNGTILDPFMGSGSTGKAVMYENKDRNKNYKYIGIELTEEYLPISKARIEYVCNLKEENKIDKS